jgi:hypothetical protein
MAHTSRENKTTYLGAQAQEEADITSCSRVQDGVPSQLLSPCVERQSKMHVCMQLHNAHIISAAVQSSFPPAPQVLPAVPTLQPPPPSLCPPQRPPAAAAKQQEAAPMHLCQMQAACLLLTRQAVHRPSALRKGLGCQSCGWQMHSACRLWEQQQQRAA